MSTRTVVVMLAERRLLDHFRFDQLVSQFPELFPFKASRFEQAIYRACRLAARYHEEYRQFGEIRCAFWCDDRTERQVLEINYRAPVEQCLHEHVVRAPAVAGRAVCHCVDCRESWEEFT